MPRRKLDKQSGLTLVELIIVIAILGVISVMALPWVKLEAKRQKERELRRDLWSIRDGIDRYKDMADRNLFQTKVDSFGYPPDLDTLVKGIDTPGGKIKFLRRVPVDPMTVKPEWGLRSMQDKPDADSWGGENVFDVYSLSPGTAFDGTKYKDW